MTNRHFASHLAAAALLVGSLACASPVFAADDAEAPAMAPAPAAEAPATPHPNQMSMEHRMEDRVENRIKTLHEKLKITPDQESAWGNVAQAMQDNEKQIEGLIHDRHEQMGKRTAIEDMQGYQKIAQAHAEGLQKVIDAFSPLYDSMSDNQKANADKVFGSFEGHEHGTHGMHKDMRKPAAK